MILLLHPLCKQAPQLLLAFTREVAWRVSPTDWITSQLQQQACRPCRLSRLPAARQRSC